MRYNVGVCQKKLKGEDAVSVHITSGDNKYVVLAIADGHGGSVASKLSIQTLCEEIDHIEETENFMIQLFSKIHEAVIATNTTSGCTFSLCIWNTLSGNLICANCGDSDIIWFESSTYTILTVSHRLQHNPQERERLRKQGVHIAQSLNMAGEPFGQYRMWPGGLSMSRSIGDADVPACLHDPSVTQACVKNGILVACSDGVWDVMSIEKVRRIVSKTDSETAASQLCHKGEVGDDKSAIVLQIEDMMVPKSFYKGLVSRSPSNSSLSDESENELILKVPV